MPLYRGAAPIPRCLERGDLKTGVSILFTVLKMDAGPIVKQVVKELNGSEKSMELLQEMFTLGTQVISSLFIFSIHTYPFQVEYLYSLFILILSTCFYRCHT